MAVHKVFIVVDGGIAQVRYRGPLVLQPGDTLDIEIRDFDLEGSDDEPTGYDDNGNPYLATDGLTLQIAQ